MKTSIKNGLIMGGVGLVINICVAGVIGFCGPLVAVVAGAAAGALTVRQSPTLTPATGPKEGATAGLTAGALIFVAQLIGALIAVVYLQSIGGSTLFGDIPEVGNTAENAGFYIGAAATGLCIGIVDVVAAAGAGWLTAKLMIKDTSQAEIQI